MLAWSPGTRGAAQGAAVVLPDLRERYETLGMDIGGGSSEEFGAFLKSEKEKWAKVVKLSGAKVE